MNNIPTNHNGDFISREALEKLKDYLHNQPVMFHGLPIGKFKGIRETAEGHLEADVAVEFPKHTEVSAVKVKLATLQRWIGDVQKANLRHHLLEEVERKTLETALRGSVHPRGKTANALIFDDVDVFTAVQALEVCMAARQCGKSYYRQVVSHLVEQYRFPRSKKRRIRNKWAKNPRNWRPSTKALVDTKRHMMYASHEFFARVRRAQKAVDFGSRYGG